MGRTERRELLDDAMRLLGVAGTDWENRARRETIRLAVIYRRAERASRDLPGFGDLRREVREARALASKTAAKLDRLFQLLRFAMPAVNIEEHEGQRILGRVVEAARHLDAPLGKGIQEHPISPEDVLSGAEIRRMDGLIQELDRLVPDIPGGIGRGRILDARAGNLKRRWASPVFDIFRKYVPKSDDRSTTEIFIFYAQRVYELATGQKDEPTATGRGPGIWKHAGEVFKARNQ